MADIRINSLPTTASASSSDDFLALDGATNGTRKLNAYSPTFGGNLTVNGGSTSGQAFFNSAGSYGFIQLTDAGSTAGNALIGTGAMAAGASVGDVTIRQNNDSKAFLVSGVNNNWLKVTSSAATILGNLTVSGTGNSSFSGTVNAAVGVRCTATNANLSLYKDATPSKAARVILNGSVADGLSLGLFNGTSWTDTLHISTSNNVLLFTTTDSGNGKLQLADHTTSAGGIGFGTDSYFYRRGTGEFVLGSATNSVCDLSGSSGNTQAIIFKKDSAETARIATPGSSTSLIFYTGSAVTALTLDSSQNATFAGQVLAGAGFVLGWNGRGHLIAPSDGVITLLNAASTDFNRLQFGGTTASFPSLKRSTSVLTCVLADDSAFATFRALDFSAQGAATTVGANQVSYGGTTATTATAGAQTLPANPVGFIIVNVAGTTAKIPYYAN